jgi:hypothetical protein
LSLFFARTNSFGQTGGNKTYSLYNAYWSTAGGFQSLAQLHNNSPSETLAVEPLLYTADGQSIALNAVPLAPLGNATIDIGAELAAKGWNRPLTGSAVFQYQQKSPGDLTVEVYQGNAPNSISFTIPSTETPYSSPTQNAVFWLPSSNSVVYVSLQNISTQPIHVTPSITINGQTMPLAPVLIAGNGSAVVYIPKALAPYGGWQQNAVGGITVTQDGPPGALNTGGWIEDDGLEYSSTITFANPLSPGQQLIGTQVLVGSAGAALDLPGDFTISSQLVLRNTSNQPANVKGNLTFSDNQGGLASAPINAVNLAAGAVIGIDLGQVKTQAGVPASFVAASIDLRYSGASGALMGRVFGITPDGSCGFYWALQPTAGWSYNESFWSTQGNWTPIFTVGNFASTPDQVSVVLTSNQGTYTLPVLSLQPMESRTINIRDLINTAQPFPGGADFGGFRVRGASTQSKLIVKEHLIDPVLKLTTPFYGSYTYVLSVFFYETETQLDAGGESSATAGAGDTYSIAMGALFSDSTYAGICPSDDESGSYNTEVATLAFTGCYGQLDGIAGGTTEIWANTMQYNDSGGDVGTFTAEEPVTVQVPTLLSGPMVSAVKTYTGQALTDCYGTNQGINWYGYTQCGSYTVLDQESPPVQIKASGIAFSEVLTVVASNPSGVQNNSGSGATDANFILMDFYAFGSQTATPPSGTYVVYKQTITATSTGKAVRVNCLDYETSGITVTDITSSPGTTCTR